MPIPLHCIGKLRVLKAKGPGSLACFWHLAHGEINSTFKLQSKCTHTEAAGKQARSRALTWSHWLSPSAGCTRSSFTRFAFVYAGVVILGFHSYWLDFSFNLFIWKNMDSFGPENIWVVFWLFVLLKSPQEKHQLISRNTIPLLQPEEPQNFHSSCPFPFSLQYILLQDYLYNTLFATNRYFSPSHYHLVFQNRKRPPFQQLAQ